LIESEIHRRSSGGSRGTASDADTKSQERYLEKLRHSFVDDSGKFSADAAVVEVTKETVRLRTIEEGKELIVPLTRLSEADRRWLLENDGWIKTYGKKYEQSIMGGGGN
jgi:hypothetical protein